VKFGTFTDSSSGAVNVEDAEGATAAASKDNVEVTVTDWFTFADGKGVLNAETTKVTKIVADESNKTKNLLKTGNTLKTSEITVAKSEEDETKLNVVIDSAAKRYTAEEVYNVTFQINGVPCVVDVTFEAHELTTVEAAQNVSAVVGAVTGLSSLEGTGSSSETVAPVKFTASAAGNNVTLTASPVTIEESDENTTMVQKWYSGGTKDDTVVAIMVTCPEGAQGLKATGGKDETEGGKVINLTGAKEEDGKSLILAILIEQADLTAKSKEITLTWYTDTSCTDANKMGDTVTYTFDLNSITWVPAPEDNG